MPFQVRLPAALRGRRIFSSAASWAAPACVAAVLACSVPAQAASLQVSPILLQFAPQEQAQGVWLSNAGTQPLRAQVRVQRWSQAGGSDQLEAARDLIASPPAIEIGPGQRQLVRIVRPQTTAAPQERAYRLIVDELPSTQDPVPAATAAPGGLQFLLRYSIPVFIAPEGTPAASARTAAPALTDVSLLAAQWRPGAQPMLNVANPGARRVRLSQLAYESDGQRTMLVPGLLGYVLAGQRMQFQLPAAGAALAPGGVFKARFNDDAQEQVLPLRAAAS